MKIIVLDMDGVLCTARSHVAAGKRGTMEKLDPIGIGLLNRLADEETRYVLSSSWRHHFGREEMEARLRAEGWTGAFHDDWCTVGRFSGTRGMEIEAWLGAHDHWDKPYVIFDDEIHDFANRVLAHKLVQTNFDDGISFSDFEKARTILHGITQRMVFL